MNDISKITELLVKIAEVGNQHPSPPLLNELFPFRHYFDENGKLLRNKLSENDGLWTRREILTRFLYLQAVLDQGPDIVGIRQLTRDVTNHLYEKEVRFLHKPLDFFKEVGISVDEIWQSHEAVKSIRAVPWAKENKSTPGKYNLFMDNAKQVLGYAVYRWGVPLAVPYLREKDLGAKGEESNEPLVDYLESYSSGEMMSQAMKDDERYGLGKAIGDKAAHLFAKWYIHTFALCRRVDTSWDGLSYELPLDSNAGRVLFRTGFLMELATLENYKSAKWDVIQIGKGKGKENYIRVTNIRDKKTDAFAMNSDLGQKYQEIATQHLKTHKRAPESIRIQRIFNAILKGTQYCIGHLDDGIIHIGTTYCRNHETPHCKECPINKHCEGYQKHSEWITDYRT